jgi:predicted O-methyltransferase YrrM
MFSQNWFETLALNNFETYIKPLFNNKVINYLEIGCFEGNCTLYMCKNVLNELSKITVIDPFENSKTHQNAYNTFTTNLDKYLNRINIIKGFSQKELQNLNQNTYDFIYIDGDHTSYAALVDGILSWPLLKSGGIMAFDDYMWLGGSSDLENSNNPYTGINFFLNMYENQYDLIVKNWQIIIKKK